MPHLRGMLSHVTFHFQFLRVNKEKPIPVFMKQSNIFVPDKCEITVDKKILVDLHNLRKSKSVTLCPALPLFQIYILNNR